MTNIETVVLSSYKMICEKKGLSTDVNLQDKFDRSSGIDSLGIVEFIIEIEDNLDISLDAVLADIRKCSTFQEASNIITNYSCR